MLPQFGREHEKRLTDLEQRFIKQEELIKKLDERINAMNQPRKPGRPKKEPE